MRIENWAPASPWSAAKFFSEMNSLGVFPEDDLANTWKHENKHHDADEKSDLFGGEFGYSVEIEFSDGLFVAGFIVAHYAPKGDRTPQDHMKIALAPDDPSEQDKKIYNLAWRSWINDMHYEKLRAEEERMIQRKETEEKTPATIPLLIAIPPKDGEKDSDYIRRAEVVSIFGRKIEEMSENGSIPPLDGVISGDIYDLLDNNWSEISKAYDEALKEHDSKREDGNEELSDANDKDTESETEQNASRYTTFQSI